VHAVVFQRQLGELRPPAGIHGVLPGELNYLSQQLGERRNLTSKIRVG
jgi:hypothetical protein